MVCGEMKVKIEVDEQLGEEEIVIRCRELDERVLKLQNLLREKNSLALSREKEEGQQMVLHQGETDYYVDLEEILFFETQSKIIYAHSRQQMWQTQYKLYELEEMLPGYFMRISKSTIVNLNGIYAITRNLTASSKVEFAGTHKHVYVSRNYYKALIQRLADRRQQRMKE